ncbi:MAG: O-antigen ligase family protein [Synergistaceae bacterium]|jgi:O-antigen ligase|nr:O-antigen ligase family protein [Synergistaceae bacterium]
MSTSKGIKQKNKDAINKIVESNGAEKPLVPKWLYYGAFMLSFTLPNLVYSGLAWFDTLHIMKWFATMAPIGVITLTAGVTLCVFGAKRTKFTLDPFAMVWLLLMLLVTAQPLFIKLTSASTFLKEWFFFVTLIGVYILAYNLRPHGKLFMAILWGSAVNAAINVLFAELLIRNMNSEIPFIRQFIMDVPGNYIGNTGQQEMFGLWMAIAVFNSLFLHTRYSGDWKTNIKSGLLIVANMFLLAVNSCGLWRSTARGGILALVVATVVLLAIMLRNKEYKATKNIAAMFGVVFVFLVLVMTFNSSSGTNRGGELANKFIDMARNPGTFGGRIAIWRISNEIFLTKPIEGVGLGNYKWHFLDGQRIFYEKHPELLGTEGYNWQYTYWAHSEYLQWLCETGIIGALILAALGLWWIYRFLKALIEGKPFTPEALWGCAAIFLLWFDAIFSRPFHRIENAVWMSLAFALANRTLMPDMPKWMERDNDFIYRAFGCFMVVISLSGFIFLGGGMMGDQILREAVYDSSQSVKRDMARGAQRFPMSRDDAVEQAAILDIFTGRQNGDTETYIRGARGLYNAFMARPNSERLYRLFDSAREMQNIELMKALLPYLPPGTESIE